MNTNKFSKIRSSRGIHLIDIENLCASSDLSVAAVSQARDAYLNLVRPGQKDQFVIASSHHNAEAAYFGWPGGWHGLRSGENGADLVLAEYALENKIYESFGHVYLGSGDGGLAPVAENLVRSGSSLTVVSRIGYLSHDYQGLDADRLYLTSTWGLVA